MSDQQDSEKRGQYRYARGFSTDNESFPQTEGQRLGTEFGYVEAAPANDAEPDSEHRTQAAPPRHRGEKQ